MLLNSLFKHWTYRILAPGTLLREKYQAMKHLLRSDISCHEHMAEFQECLHGEKREDFCCTRQRFTIFSEMVRNMVENLDILAPTSYTSLKEYHKKFDFYTRFLLAPEEIDCDPPFILPLHSITAKDHRVGNKAKNLSVIHTKFKAPVPRGFAVTTSGYHLVIEHNNLREKIDGLLADLDLNSHRSLHKTSLLLTRLITDAELPPELEMAILDGYDTCFQIDNAAIEVAVRSNAIGEDGEFSFAGQYASLLRVPRADICAAYKQVVASKYSAESIFYRINRGIGDEDTAMSVLIQQMIPASYSGVLYTRGPEQTTEEDEQMHLHVGQGLGEQLVDGSITPETYILSRHNPSDFIVSPMEEDGLSSDQVTQLAEWGLIFEQHFGAPQDIEWAIDQSGTIHILQTRTLQRFAISESRDETDKHQHDVLIDGCKRASYGIGIGNVVKVHGVADLDDLPQGAVIVCRETPIEFVKVLDRVDAVLAEKGSHASHFATVAREFGVPFLIGIDNIFDRFKQHDLISVDGNSGTVFQGAIAAKIDRKVNQNPTSRYHRILREALQFITPLELIDPAAENFTPEGCRSMHDIIRFCHEKALTAMFSTGRPGSSRGSLRLAGDIPLDVFLFDVGGGISTEAISSKEVPLSTIASQPFQALWQGLNHPGIQWLQKPFDWDAYDRIELSGAVPPSKDSFVFASYAVVGRDYLHFNIRFGYHFTIVDALCGKEAAKNHCMVRFAGGGGDYDHRSLRINFLVRILEDLDFSVKKKGDLLEARIQNVSCTTLQQKLDLLGRLLGASKLMDMVLEDDQMVADCVADFHSGRYSFSQQG